MGLTELDSANILMVDDNVNNLKVLSGILAEYPFKIRRAINGAIALKSIAATAPDLILLDICLPDYSGYDICKQLKQHSATADIPIIFISALNSTLDKVKAFAAGGVDYITKPFEISEVKARIQNQLQLRRAKLQVDQLNAQLEERVTQRTAQLMAATASLEQQVEERLLAEQALQQSERQFRAMIENASDLIFLLEPQGIVHYASPSVERSLGYRPQALIGQPLTQWLHPQDQETTTQLLAEVFAHPGIPRTLERQWQSKQGTWCTFEMIVQHFSDATGFTGIVVNARDITERQIAEAMQLALAQEKELSELKLRFFSMASHEFRTPLSVILMAAQILANSDSEKIEEKHLRNIERIQSSAQYLKKMLADVLDIARLEAQQLEFKPQSVCLQTLCDRILDTQQTQPEEGPRIHFTYAGPSTEITLDPHLVHSILTNLLTNALKYSDAHQPVQFQVVLTDTQVEFTIADQGIGIPQSSQAQLFEVFHRGENVGQREGSGLGLAIVKKCVDLHGGDISFKSDPSGTTFIVQLPLDPTLQQIDPIMKQTMAQGVIAAET